MRLAWLRVDVNYFGDYILAKIQNRGAWRALRCPLDQVGFTVRFSSGLRPPLEGNETFVWFTALSIGDRNPL